MINKSVWFLLVLRVPQVRTILCWLYKYVILFILSLAFDVFAGDPTASVCLSRDRIYEAAVKGNGKYGSEPIELKSEVTSSVITITLDWQQHHRWPHPQLCWNKAF